MNIESTRVFKITQDQWHPPYKINGYHEGVENPWMVEVSWIRYEDGSRRVCVWGADDHGLERDFEPGQHDEALALFMDVIAQKYVNHGYLKGKGFVQA